MQHFETNTIVDAEGYVRVHVGSPGQAVHVRVDSLGGDAGAFHWAAVTHTPGVCGGRACVANTRLTVWFLEALRRMGCDDADIVRRYPQLSLNDLACAWAYVGANPGEIDDDLRQQDEA